MFGKKPDAAAIARLVELENQISTGLAAFHSAGLALVEIRDRKLFAHKWHAFDTYCEERWNLSTAHVSRLIAAANVCENLAGLEPLPGNEAQARVLAPLTPGEQRAVWAAANESLPIGNITAEALEEVAGKVAPKRKRARHRKPKMISLRGKGWSLKLTRRTADVDPVSALTDAIEKLRAKQATKSAKAA